MAKSFASVMEAIGSFQSITEGLAEASLLQSMWGMTTARIHRITGNIDTQTILIYTYKPLNHW